MKSNQPHRTVSGYSLLELVVAMGLILIMGSVALPNINGYRQEYALTGAAQAFKSEFMRARSIATMKNTQTAIRFEAGAAGEVMYSTYIDGNSNGVLAADIARGVGEPPIIPAPAAIANAIQNATGVRLTELPMSPERIALALVNGKH